MALLLTFATIASVRQDPLASSPTYGINKEFRLRQRIRLSLSLRRLHSTASPSRACLLILPTFWSWEWLSTRRGSMRSSPAARSSLGSYPETFRSAPFWPLVRDTALAPWLAGSPPGLCSLFNQSSALLERDHGRLPLVETACYAAQGIYADASSYVQTYSRLLAFAAHEEEVLARVSFVEEVPVQWELSLGNLVGSVERDLLASIRSDGRDDSQQFTFVCSSPKEIQWRGTGSVLPREAQSADAPADGQDTGELLRIQVFEFSEPPPADGLFTVSPVWRSTNHERQQSALRMLRDHPAAMSSSLRSQIIGDRVDAQPTPIRVRIPSVWRAPSIPAPNSSQLEAIAEAPALILPSSKGLPALANPTWLFTSFTCGHLKSVALFWSLHLPTLLWTTWQIAWWTPD
jgi:hypothetical protein